MNDNNIIDSGPINIIARIKDKDKDKETHAQVIPRRKKVGRPAYLVTSDTRAEVYNLSIVGTRYEDIALVMGMSNDTLKKHYKNELEKGRIEANAAVAGTLYEKAKQGDTSSMIFWLKTRAQWSEKNTTELTGEGGAPINIKVITGID
tara:strand:- start:37 stop:480 length:444 start_codon:yes stop_codon:yes gene_type:complete